MNDLVEMLLSVLMLVSIFFILWTTFFIFGVVLNIVFLSFILGIIILLFFKYRLEED